MSRKNFCIIDGFSYLYRSFFGLPRMTSRDGLPTNAIYGFSRLILKLKKELDPDMFAVAWDAVDGGEERTAALLDYKANRDPMPEDLGIQLPYVKELLNAYQIPCIELPGIEADDVIGTLSRLWEKKEHDIYIVSTDKDLMQLVDDHVWIYDTMKDVKYDREKVYAKMGVYPEQIADLLGLMGDASDNIPGVKGVGPKTAQKLLADFQNMEGVYANLANITGRTKDLLIEHRDVAVISKKLATLMTDLTLPEMDLDFRQPDWDKLEAFCTRVSFTKLMAETATHFGGASKTTAHVAKPTTSSKHAFEIVQDEEALRTLIKNMTKAGMCALDTETTSLDSYACDLVGMSFAYDAEHSFYIPLKHVTPERQLDTQLALTLLRPLFEDAKIKKIGHNIKFDMIVISRAYDRCFPKDSLFDASNISSLHWGGIFADTMIASYLLDPNTRKHGLKELSQDFLSVHMPTYEETAGEYKDFSFVPLADAARYASLDAHATWRLYTLLSERLHEAELYELFATVEMPLLSVLFIMEYHGVLIDEAWFQELKDKFQHELAQLEKKIYQESGEEFLISSTQQLSRILFEKMGIPPLKKTKTGFSTDSEVLEELKEKYEIAAHLVEYRTLNKLLGTYVLVLPNLRKEFSGRIHTSFNQTIAATGRLSSTDPNLQNIPIRTEWGRELRRGFIAQKGYFLMSADYSQIELRLLAHFSQDPVLIDWFTHELDVHTMTATQIFHVTESEVSPEMRRKAKIVNFGLIYGMTPFGLAKSLGISQGEARSYIDAYFERFPNVQTYFDSVVEHAKEVGYVSTLFGRKRQIVDINSRNPAVFSHARREAINTPLQGSNADIIKKAMIDIDLELKRRGLVSALILQVHDELVLEVLESELDEVKELVKSHMEGAVSLSVPLTVEVGVGLNWLQAH